MSRLLVPVRYSAWLSGELGRTMTQDLEAALQDLPELRLTRMPRGWLVESTAGDGVALEATATAVKVLEASTAQRYPVFHHEMGPVWTGTIQVIFGVS